jgi:MFS family permease
MVHPPTRDGAAAGVQRRTLAVLVATQVLGGVGTGTAVAVSSLVAARLSGSDLIGGAALTCVVVGAAGTAVILARVATRRGRRPALSLGYVLAALGSVAAVVGIGVRGWPVLMAGLVLQGAGTAAGLAARFAGTDLAAPQRRARALSVVVWATTVGAVAGPNLSGPAERLASGLGLLAATGPFLLAAAVYAAASLIIWFGLRPDPLLLARQSDGPADDATTPRAGDVQAALRSAPAAQLALAGIVLSHLVMIALMSMTPVHMDHSGASLQLVGVVISLHVAGMFALSPVFGWLADRAGRLPVLAAGAVLLIVAGGLGAAADGHETGVLSVALVALGLGWSAALVAGSTLLTESVPLPVRPRVQGSADVAMNLSGALGGVLAGLTVAGTSFAVLGVAAAVLAAPYLVLLLRFLLRRVPAGA